LTSLREQMRSEGQRRRKALVQAGCSTYRMGVDHVGEPRSILCLCCGILSFNSGDIVNRYCGVCSEYHSEWGEEAQ
jgi:hypothetical protein